MVLVLGAISMHQAADGVGRGKRRRRESELSLGKVEVEVERVRAIDVSLLVLSDKMSNYAQRDGITKCHTHSSSHRPCSTTTSP